MSYSQHVYKRKGFSPLPQSVVDHVGRGPSTRITLVLAFLPRLLVLHNCRFERNTRTAAPLTHSLHPRITPIDKPMTQCMILRLGMFACNQQHETLPRKPGHTLANRQMNE
jgi:hypothetical protein